jgi:intracellular sulfur oxidation DsrE/DsrF family protein
MKPLLLFLLLSTSGLAGPNEKTLEPLKAVIQVNDGAPDKLEGALRNIAHIVTAAHHEGRKIEISAMVFGSALPQFKKTGKPTRDVLALQAIMKTEPDVHWFACENTLKRFEMVPADLVAGFKTVPSGALEVLKLQQTGYLYFRP